MKLFKYILRTFLLVFTLSVTTHVNAQSDYDLGSMDSVDICLLTCGPGQESYSMFGHTALRIHDKARQQDLAINYGMFSFSQPNFILRFILGQTDYTMGIQDMSDFIWQYQHEGRWIKQQKLQLSRKEKWEILQAIQENSRPENITYRYNFFFNNCTTKARDIILDHINRQEDVKGMAYIPSTYRKEIHKWNASSPWTQFGEDLLLGVSADFDISQSEYQFLPENLSNDWNHIQLTGHFDSLQNQKMPLVESTSWLISKQDKTENSGYILTPTVCFALLFIFTIVISLYEYRTGKKIWALDIFFYFATGIVGIVLFAMLFSKHPTVQCNLQILMFNPLVLAFGWSVIKSLQKRAWSKWAIRYSIFYGICLVLMLIGAFIQTYQPGIIILALSLLFRIIFNLKYNR